MDNRWKNKIFDINRPISSYSPSNLTMQNFMMSSNSASNGDHRMNDNEKLFMNPQNHSSENLWTEQYEGKFNAPKDPHGPHMLPLARIKKVMKANEEVKMVSAETPMVFSKACELLIMELSQRAWIHTTENNRRTVQRSDVGKAIRDDKTLEFLKDTVPLDFKQVMVDETGVQDPSLEDQEQEIHHQMANSSRVDYSMNMQNFNPFP